MTDLLSDLKALVAKYDAQPEPIPEPTPDPVPTPVPDPVPQPIPVPIPDPQPVPTPQPNPVPMTPDVTNAAELAAAIAAAKSGDTITLAGGSYGALTITGKAGLTLASADPANPATFSGGTIARSKQITLDGLTIAKPIASADNDWLAGLKIDTCDTVTLTNCAVSNGIAVGGQYDGYSKGYPIQISKSANVAISGGMVSGGHRAIMLVDSDGITVDSCDITGFRAVAIGGGGNNNVTITRNHCYGANPYNWPADDHGDYIHLWTDAARGPATGIVIEGNWLDQGAGLPIMGISLQNTGGHYFVDARVTNNLIRTSNDQGIRFDGVQKIDVSGNTIVSPVPVGNLTVNVGGNPRTMSVGQAKFVVNGAQSGVVERNIWGRMSQSPAGVTIQNNLNTTFAQQAATFANPKGTTRADFVALASGPGAGLGIAP